MGAQWPGYQAPGCPHPQGRSPPRKCPSCLAAPYLCLKLLGSDWLLETKTPISKQRLRAGLPERRGACVSPKSGNHGHMETQKRAGAQLRGRALA